MKKSEIAKLLALIIAASPDSKAKPDAGTVDAWHWLLGDLDFSVALSATKKVLCEQEYPTMPAVGKIRKAATLLVNPQKLSAPEAWEQVLFAVRRFGYIQEAEARAMMAPLVVKAVDCVGWRDICLSENIDTVRAQFRMAYEALERRANEVELMAPDVKNVLESATQKKELGA